MFKKKQKIQKDDESSKVLGSPKFLEKPSKSKEHIINLIENNPFPEKNLIVPTKQKIQKDQKDDENSKVLGSLKSVEKPSKSKEHPINHVENNPFPEKNLIVPTKPNIQKDDESSKVLGSLKSLEKPSKSKEHTINHVENNPFPEKNLKIPTKQKVPKDAESSKVLGSILAQKTPKPLEKPSSKLKAPTLKFSKEKPLLPNQKKKKDAESSNVLRSIKNEDKVNSSNNLDCHINFEALVEENTLSSNSVKNNELSQQNQFNIPKDPFERVNWVFELFHSKAKLVEYIRKAPPRKSSSINEIVKYISACTKDKLETYMLIFIWVTFNIEYDTESYFNKQISKGSCNAEAVFQNGSCVCAGYSSIFSEFCSRMKLPSIEISGYSKGYSYVKNQTFESTNHAWNAIELDGKYYLIDSTWGAGACNGEKQFVQNFNPFYFMCPPQFFIENHLPKQDSLQFLQVKITKKQFEENYLYHLSHYFKKLYENWNNRHVLISPAFILLHLDGKNQPNNIFNIRLKLPGKKILTTLTSKDGQKPDEEISNATFKKQVENDEFEVQFRVPYSGNFELNIFSAEFPNTTYHSEFAYKIFCNNFKLERKRFPKTFSFEAAYDLIEPLEYAIPLKSNTAFKIKLTGYNKVAVIQNSNFCDLTLNTSTGVWEGIVKINCKRVSLSAQKEQKGSYHTICEYIGF